jgi:hypothetical protein
MNHARFLKGIPKHHPSKLRPHRLAFCSLAKENDSARILTLPWTRPSSYRKREIIQGANDAKTYGRPMLARARTILIEALRDAHRWVGENQISFGSAQAYHAARSTQRRRWLCFAAKSARPIATSAVSRQPGGTSFPSRGRSPARRSKFRNIELVPLPANCPSEPSEKNTISVGGSV